MRAVNDVSFDVERDECLGLVGESGCGKTTLSKMLMRGISADPNEGAGRVVFDDWGRKIDVLSLEGDDLDRFRTKLQFIFQDPFGSLNPRMTVYDILVEPLIIHKIGDDAYRREMVSELMEMVGLDRRHLSRYPHSFSGGQRQRIGIARALALRPDMVICDEPVSALDVSIQAQILNLLKDLQKQLGLTYHVHLAQSRGGRLHRRPHRRDVRRPPGRAGAGGRAVPQPAASLHQGAAVGGARCPIPTPASISAR